MTRRTRKVAVLSRVGASQPQGKQNGSVDSQCESRSQPASGAVRIPVPTRMRIIYESGVASKASAAFSPQPCWWLCNQAQGVRWLAVGLLFESVTRRYWDATNNLVGVGQRSIDIRAG